MYSGQQSGQVRYSFPFEPMQEVGKAAVAIFAVATMLGCSSTNLKGEKWLNFRCPDGRSVLARFEPKDEFVNVQFEGRDFRLPKTISASGARYSDGKTTFWNKGRSALMEVNDKIGCRTVFLRGSRKAFMQPYCGNRQR
jgi:membrane-bound inhibitor of C-type lysozyme